MAHRRHDRASNFRTIMAGYARATRFRVGIKPRRRVGLYDHGDNQDKDQNYEPYDEKLAQGIAQNGYPARM